MRKGVVRSCCCEEKNFRATLQLNKVYYALVGTVRSRPRTQGPEAVPLRRVSTHAWRQ